MKASRKTKKFNTQSWFKTSRGGKDLTPKKDRPFEVQEGERNRRKEGRAGSCRIQLEVKGSNAEKEMKTEGREVQIKEVEAVLFIPATPDSILRKLIQKAEDQTAKLMNSPTVRVVERAGTKIIEEVGDNNPWKKEWACPRADCLPCQGQVILAQEAEEEAIKMVCGEEGR